MNWKEIEIPNYMKSLKLDSRGFPIPYIILIDDAGTPHFKINDSTKAEVALKHRFCAICGNKMGKFNMWLVGGPQSAFHPNGMYFDTAVHKQCGEYALKVCPYLASRNYNSLAPPEQVVDKVQGSDRHVFVDPTVDPTRPAVFAFVRIKDFKVRRNGLERYVIPIRPYSEIEFWKEGKLIPHMEAVREMVEAGTIKDLVFENEPVGFERINPHTYKGAKFVDLFREKI